MIQVPLEDTLFIILEPGNVRRMKQLEPLVVKNSSQYTRIGIVLVNDIVWVGEEMRRLMTAEELTVEALDKILHEDLNRPAIDRGTDTN